MREKASFKTGPKHAELIAQYETMAKAGYETIYGENIETAFSDFELRRFRENILPIFQRHKARSVLDYGCGGSDWEAPGFHEDQSALAYFGLEKAYRFEPARKIDERRKTDIVSCFDVLEHIFITDVPATLVDILSCAKKAVILNIACYEAQAILPCGENAHITVRNPLWWKGCLDTIAVLFPNVEVNLICSPEYSRAEAFPPQTMEALVRMPGFVR